MILEHTLLYPEERRSLILDRLNRERRVTVSSLAETFGVSEVTIRTDLQALEGRALIVRTHGGAVAARPLPEAALTLRRQLQTAQKERIGLAAASLVLDGEAIFLDTSSTALALAAHLRERRGLTLLTNSIVVAQNLLDAVGVTVVIPGGVLQRDTASLIGTEGLSLLRRYNIRKGFFGAHGVSLAEGLTDVYASEAEVKRSVFSLCRERIAITDGTKWGRVGAASFARLEDLDSIITDDSAPDELVKQVRSMGIDIKIV
jgi:DeoR/GlpR family transcriptional regulator of sugar metabolism